MSKNNYVGIIKYANIFDVKKKYHLQIRFNLLILFLVTINGFISDSRFFPEFFFTALNFC